MEFFFQNSLNFPNLKLRLVEKLKFGQIFVQNLSTSGLFKTKNQVFWQIIEFLNDLLEFFFGLSFFSKCPKKPGLFIYEEHLYIRCLPGFLFAEPVSLVFLVAAGPRCPAGAPFLGLLLRDGGWGR